MLFDVLWLLVLVGVCGLFGGVFGIDLYMLGYDVMCDEFFVNYVIDLCVYIMLFLGIGDVFDEFDVCGVCWGIVMNKVMWFMVLFVELFGFVLCVVCVVGGDIMLYLKLYLVLLLYVVG